MKKILGWLACHILGAHDWTSKAQEGIKPNHIELANPILGFKMYAQMYCKKCGKISKLNNRL